MGEKVSLKDFIDDLKQNINNITRSDLQGIIEARCMKTGENEEEILKILDEYVKLKK